MLKTNIVINPKFCSAIWNAEQQHLTAWSSAPQRNPKAALPTWQLSITEPSDRKSTPTLHWSSSATKQNFFYDQPMKNLPIGRDHTVSHGFAYGNLDLTLALQARHR